MSKQNVTVRHDPDVIDKVAFVAEKIGIDEAVLWRRLVTSATSITRLYREWKRIETEVDSLPAKDTAALQDREASLLDRVEDLSAAEEHLLDAIQEELMERAQDPDAERVPA